MAESAQLDKIWNMALNPKELHLPLLFGSETIHIISGEKKINVPYLTVQMQPPDFQCQTTAFRVLLSRWNKGPFEFLHYS